MFTKSPLYLFLHLYMPVVLNKQFGLEESFSGRWNWVKGRLFESLAMGLNFPIFVMDLYYHIRKSVVKIIQRDNIGLNT